jgi:trehalose 6-phosphate phosphatase
MMSEQKKIAAGEAWPIERAALFLDLDGTLAPIVETPSEARVDEACRRMLACARERLGGRVAILSGRTIAEVDEILGGAVVCVAGVHGLQRRNALGEIFAKPPHGRVAQAAATLEALARKTPGLLVEAKGPSVAIHYRQARRAEAAVLEAVERIAAASGLELQLGKAVAELRTPGPNKATALQRFMLEAPFRGACPLFVGDDLTDETAFAEARRRGGAGVLVGEPRPTEATGRLADPSDVVAWIGRALEIGRFELETAA